MDIFDIKNYDYVLPPELIANQPADRRDSSRLLVYDRQREEIVEVVFHDLLKYLTTDWVLVFNNSRVFKARLVVLKKGKGWLTEMLVLREVENEIWEVMFKRAKKVKVGDVYSFQDGGETIEFRVVDVAGEGRRLVKVDLPRNRFLQALDRAGVVPLPPYIERQSGVDYEAVYQTVYAKPTGSVAAPTAGLHFTDEMLDDIDRAGLERAEVTLHVGLGTFAPVRHEDIRRHDIHAEELVADQLVIDRLNQLKRSGKKILAVGTTAARWLESLADEDGFLKTRDQNMTKLFIYPGYRFRFVDGLLTNFHLPKSTLLMLVAAFLGKDDTGVKKLHEIYQLAMRKKFRFYSFGDAMLIK